MGCVPRSTLVMAVEGNIEHIAGQVPLIGEQANMLPASSVRTAQCRCLAGSTWVRAW